MFGEPQISPLRRSISAQLRKPLVLTAAAVISVARNGRGGGGGGVVTVGVVGSPPVTRDPAASGEPGRNFTPAPIATSPATSSAMVNGSRRLRRRRRGAP